MHTQYKLNVMQRSTKPEAKAFDRHNTTSLFPISSRVMIVTRIVTSIAFMLTVIFVKIHSWKEDKTQYLLTDFAAITAL